MLVNEVPIATELPIIKQSDNPFDDDESKQSNLFSSFSNLQSFNENQFKNSSFAKYQTCAPPDNSIPYCGFSLSFTSNVTYKNFQIMKNQFLLIFKVAYPEDFFKKIYDKKYFTILGIDKVTKELTCFAVLDINQKEKTADILALGVVKELQSKKLGSTMMKKIVEELSSMGISEVKLIVQETNASAFRLYEKFGFGIQKTLNDYYKFDSEKENKAYLMTKILIPKTFWIFEMFKQFADKLFLKQKNNISST